MTETLSPDTPVRAGVPTEAGRYLTFRLGGEVFALGILDITEIIEYRSLTEVPMMPGFIRGVLNLRGRVVPVVDLSVRFGRGRTEVARRSAVIIVETSGTTDEDGQPVPGQDFGIIVDAVNEVMNFAPDDIEPAPAFGAGIRTDFISGMAKRGGDFVIVLDVSRVLSVEDMIHLAHAAGAPAPAAEAEAAADRAAEGDAPAQAGAGDGGI